MKISAIGNLYPTVLKKTVREQLKEYYNSNEIKHLQVKIKKEYKEIVRRFPDIGGHKNFFVNNIYLGAYVIAIYKNICDKVSLEDFSAIVLDSLDSLEFMKKRMQKQNFLSPEYKEKLKKVSAWCKENEDIYPENWQIEVLQTGKEDELCFQITKCGLCYLCQSEGVPQATPALCQTDFVTYGYAGVQLERNETLANGNERCLFLVKGK